MRTLVRIACLFTSIRSRCSGRDGARVEPCARGGEVEPRAADRGAGLRGARGGAEGRRRRRRLQRARSPARPRRARRRRPNPRRCRLRRRACGSSRRRRAGRGRCGSTTKGSADAHRRTCGCCALEVDPLNKRSEEDSSLRRARGAQPSGFPGRRALLAGARLVVHGAFRPAPALLRQGRGGARRRVGW